MILHLGNTPCDDSRVSIEPNDPPWQAGFLRYGSIVPPIQQQRNG
jgi:hypothetical protein